MAKANLASELENSTAAEAPTDGKMVLRVRTRSMKQSAPVMEEESRPRSAKKAKTHKAAKIDSKKPKKPPTAFFYFLEDFRKGFQEEHPDIKSMRDVGKACGEKWKTMTYEEKVQYYDIATEKRAAFDSAMMEYNKRMENREERTSDEDSEFDE